MAINRYQLVPVYVQSFYLEGSEPLESEEIEPAPGQAVTVRVSSGEPYAPVTLAPVQYIQTLTASSIPRVSTIELRQDYQELGQALSELTRLDVDDEWKIDAPVFQTASLVASQLASQGIPAPHIFNHGTQSIVFNWSNRNDNLYLTISADKVSALLSSPDRIKRRAQLPSTQIGQSHLLVLNLRAGGDESTIQTIDSSSIDFAG